MSVESAGPVRLTNYGAQDQGSGTNDLYTTVLERIRSAGRCVWIKVPWWDSSPKGRELASAVTRAVARDLDVVVLIRPEASNDAVLRLLRGGGVRVVAVRYLHEKEVVADDAAVVHSMNFTATEMSRNQNSGFLFTDPLLVDPVVAGFHQQISVRAALASGEETWTRRDDLLPEDLRPYLNRYDRFNPLQSKAVPTVLGTDSHVMVVAPTGAGKTVVGEVAALRAIVHEGRPAVWLLPARALAAEVGQALQRWERLGIRAVELTGETNMSSESVRRAQLWVATTEKFESLYRRSSLREFVADIGCLVIDEVHLVGDPQRGPTLESLIARLRAAADRTRIVALSATAANAGELAAWFNAELVEVAWRPTVLTTQLIAYNADQNDSWSERETAKNAVLTTLLRDLTSPVRRLDGRDIAEAPGSVLVFCGTKRTVREVAASAAGLHTVPEEPERFARECLKRGVGIHYRGAPQAREALDAFQARSLGVLVATSGLSTGVNTPARAVVVRDLELGRSPIDVSQVQQMFGRAGRAGYEEDGFAFLLVPRDQERDWRARLVEGYEVSSRITDRLGDALLAEVLIGSVGTREDARAWYKETFAYAQRGADADIDAVLDRLAEVGLVTEAPTEVKITESGALTSRLMVDVDSAAAMQGALNTGPSPHSPAEAEESLLALVARHVVAFRDWPVSSGHRETVDTILGHAWSRRPDADDTDGTKFSLAAALMALRHPNEMWPRTPKGSRNADFRRSAEEFPRYLAWIAGLGHAQQFTWAPAVAGDLARRLTWWNLEPLPERGSGRLLWFLENLLEPQNRAVKMPGLWRRARGAGFTSPDGINVRPKNVDVSGARFERLVGERGSIDLSTKDQDVTARTAIATARITVLARRGYREQATTLRPAQGALDVPRLADRSETSTADAFVYTKDGDFAYLGTTTAHPPVDPVAEARLVLSEIGPVARVSERRRILQRLQTTRRRTQDALRIALAQPAPVLVKIAAILSEHEPDELTAVHLLRDNLRLMLPSTAGPRPEIRDAIDVLLDGSATHNEFQALTATLIAARGLPAGLAFGSTGYLALVQISNAWHLATPARGSRFQATAVIPREITSTVVGLPELPRRKADVPLRPKFEWMHEFADSR